MSDETRLIIVSGLSGSGKSVALHVLEDGGYEMQTYARTRIPEGLALVYSRVRDGEVLRTVESTLSEVD